MWAFKSVLSQAIRFLIASYPNVGLDFPNDERSTLMCEGPHTGDQVAQEGPVYVPGQRGWLVDRPMDLPETGQAISKDVNRGGRWCGLRGGGCREDAC